MIPVFRWLVSALSRRFLVAPALRAIVSGTSSPNGLGDFGSYWWPGGLAKIETPTSAFTS